MLLPHREFLLFLCRAPLLLEEHLHHVAPARDQPQHEDAQRKGFERELHRVFTRCPRQIIQVRHAAAEEPVAQTGRHVAEATRDVELQLRRGQRTAQGVAHDEAEKEPVADALHAASHVGQRREHQPVGKVRGKNEALHQRRQRLLRADQQHGDGDVEQEIQDEELPHSQLGVRLGQRDVFKPTGEEQVIGQQQQQHTLDRQDHIPLHQAQPRRHLFRRGRGFAEEAGERIDNRAKPGVHLAGLVLLRRWHRVGNN